MTQQYLVDTGPLVALLNARDRHHAWAREALGKIALDHDFAAYRRNGRQTLPRLSPESAAPR